MEAVFTILEAAITPTLRAFVDFDLRANVFLRTAAIAYYDRYLVKIQADKGLKEEADTHLPVTVEEQVTLCVGGWAVGQAQSGL